MSDSRENEGQEKSFEASPGRIQRARREGDVPQSRDLNAAAAYGGLYLAVILASGSGAMLLAGALTSMHREPQSNALLAFGANVEFFRNLIFVILSANMHFFLAPTACVIAALFAQQAITFSPSKIKPKFSRLSFTANAKKKFGVEGITEFLKSSTKLIAIFLIFGLVFMNRISTIPGEALKPAIALPNSLQSEGIVFLGLIVLFSFAVASVDLPLSRSQHAKRLRMTHEEVKREAKENEGDPAMKKSRRDRGQSIATNKMLLDVPKADVVIVNPLHYAVALSWKRNEPGAPVCVAKGIDEIAARIRETAAAAGVPN